MRLLNVQTKFLETFYGEDIPEYAILSHTWGGDGDEILFRHINGSDDDRREGERRKGYTKLVAACEQAIKDNWKYIWIDTCCIDKESSAELSEAINSMYAWYHNSRVCYAMYAVVIAPSKADGSPEAGHCRNLSPPQDWIEIGTKAGLQDIISDITGIRVEMITGYGLKKANVAERMSWAAKRKTTRTEDIAYCLMGLFGVYMPLLYGEGQRAFMRLQEEIIKVSNDHSLFAWKTTSSEAQGLLARAPEEFKNMGNVVSSDGEGASSPYSMTNQGLQIALPLIPIDPEEDRIHHLIDPVNDPKFFKAILRCTIRDKDPTRWVVIYLERVGEDCYIRRPCVRGETRTNPKGLKLTPLFVTQVNNTIADPEYRGNVSNMEVKILPNNSGFTFKGFSLVEECSYYPYVYEHPKILVFDSKKEHFGVVIGSDNGVVWLDIIEEVNLDVINQMESSYNEGGTRHNVVARHWDSLSVKILKDWSVAVSARAMLNTRSGYYTPTFTRVVIDIRRVIGEQE